MGGLSEEDLRVEVDAIATTFGATEVQVITTDGTVDTTAAQAGLRVDTEATVAEVMAIGEEDGLFSQFRTWLAGFSGTEQADLVFIASEAEVVANLGAIMPEPTPPTEPDVVLAADGFETVPGEPSAAVDLAGAAEELLEQAEAGESPIIVESHSAEILPKRSDDEVDEFVARLNALTTSPLIVEVDGQTERFKPAEVRGWLIVEVGPPNTEISVDIEQEAPQRAVEERFPDAGQPGEPADIQIVDGRPIAAGGSTGTRCCAPGIADQVLATIEAGESRMTAELTGDDIASAELLEQLGIVELVAEFTTEHAPGQSRVTNIHRIADITRGAVIQPGASWSINDYVGPRTVEKGFVPAGVIYQGIFQEDVGGGISQYATTLFNAAFFGGLDFAEYQAHSIYISRYPYGREATVSFPAPDLRLVNNTPFGVLIWPVYTDSSITIQLYSTRHISSEQTGQIETAVDQCTRVTTQRTRTYADGTVNVDTVAALYQPQEGRDCAGNPTAPPVECPEGEIGIDTNDTGSADTCVLPEDIPCGDGVSPVDTNDDGVPDSCPDPDTPQPDPDPETPDPQGPGIECAAGETAVDLDEDGVFETCASPDPGLDGSVCPDGYLPSDPNGDGVVDICLYDPE